MAKKKNGAGGCVGGVSGQVPHYVLSGLRRCESCTENKCDACWNDPPHATPRDNCCNACSLKLDEEMG